MTLVYIAISWTVGLLLAFWLRLPMPVLAWATLWVAGGCWLERRHSRRFQIALLALVAILGAWRWHLAQPRFGPQDLATFNDQGRVAIEGYVYGEPDIRATRTQLQVSVELITLNEEVHPVRGTLLVNTPLYPTWEYGQRVRCSGLLVTPPVLDDFDYREYLASQGIHSTMSWATVELLPGRQGYPLLGALYRLKDMMRNRIDIILPSPEAGLFQGILLGLRHTLPDELNEAFRISGLTHIIVISGYNVSILLQAWFMGTRRLVHRWISLISGLGLLSLFVAFVGPSPPVVRAALMGGLFVMAQLVGRKASPLASLAATALIMTAINPFLIRSISYQLSFAATLALVLLQPRLAQSLHAWLHGGADASPPLTQILWETLLTSTAAQIATLPIIWANFRELSTVALLANVLVLPIQPLILVPGALITLISMPMPGVARLLGYLLWLPLRWTVGIARTLSTLPWASLPLPRLPDVVAWVFYALLLLFIIERPVKRIRSSGNATLEWKPLAMLCTMVAVAGLIWGAVVVLPDNHLHVYALDVGQGDALLIRSPEGHVILIDGGPDPVLLSARLGDVLPFWQRRIDLVFVTHEDSDHLMGLVPLIERYRIGRIIQSPHTANTLLSKEWRERIENQDIAWQTASPGNEISLGKSRLTVLHPPADMAHNSLDANENTLVVLLEYEDFRMLFAGDIGEPSERQLLASGMDLKTTVLKVAHHGSGGSSSPAFLARVAPQLAVISVGSDNRFGHPAEQVLERLEEIGCPVLRTDHQGTIVFTTDGKQLWIKTDR